MKGWPAAGELRCGLEVIKSIRRQKTESAGFAEIVILLAVVMADALEF